MVYRLDLQSYAQKLLITKLFQRQSHPINSVQASILARRRRYQERQIWYAAGGAEYAEGEVQRLLVASAPEELQHLTWLNKQQLLDLHSWLVDNSNLRASRKMSTLQKLCIFLFICSKGASFRDARGYWHRHISHISEAFHHVLDAMQLLHTVYVRLPDDLEQVPERIAQDPKMKYFRDCRGAIDGTHIYLSCKGSDRQTTGAEVWRNRKSFMSQNVCAVADFSMNFVFVHAGWEGSAHDAAVLKDAIQKSLISLPAGKYFVADSGYSDKTGYGGLALSPYTATRYHLREWYHASECPSTKEDWFNLRHAQLRNVVERIFGVFKNRFHIFDKPRDGYSIQDQVSLVYALTGLHNFINSYKEANVEKEWAALCRNELRSKAILDDQTVPSPPLLSGSCAVRLQSILRDAIAELMWESYLSYREQCDDAV